MPRITNINKIRFLNAFMRHEDAKAEALFLSLGEGVIVTDEKGCVSRMNQVAEDILGISQKELVGKWYPGEVFAEDLDGKPIPNMERPITRIFITGKPISQRLYYKRKDNTLVAVALTVSPVLFNQKPVGAIEVFRDITQELTLERAKDDFISIASHQLRTPATGVKQYLGMVLEGFSDALTSEQRTLLTKAYESNERQLKIIDDLLKVARIDAGHIKLQEMPVDVVALLKDIIFEQLTRIKGRGQSLKFTHDQDHIVISLDPARMRMVLENLIDNASKYTPNGKTIRVSVEKTRARVYIRVKDEGIGILKKDQPKIFQKFARLDHGLAQTVEGSGLGLYWAKKIVDLHGGQIKLQSIPKQGSVFSVELPNRTHSAKSVES